ncbi:ferredoxin [Streptosporangium saharense]|uniref:ferredoxin n=1 Tax=Streptosporangium saharense TaxID=1706840 RepID=UPI0034188374
MHLLQTYITCTFMGVNLPQPPHRPHTLEDHMKVHTDTQRCVGAGMCALTVPEVFDQSEEDGTVVLLDAEPPAGQRAAVQRAERLCPSGAISVLLDD